MKKSWCRFGVLLSLVPVLMIMSLAACASGSASETPPGATHEELVGVWMKVFDTTFEFVQDHYADAMIFEIADPENYQVLFYDATYPAWEGGQRGVYEISGNTLVLVPSERWTDVFPYSWSSADDMNSNWINDLSDYPVFPFSLAGDVLTVTIPLSIPNNSQVPLDKTAFSRPAALVGTWITNPAAATFALNGGGTYSYDPDGPGGAPTETGTSWDASGTTAGHIRRVAADVSDVSSRLVPYTLAAGVLTLNPGAPSEKVFMQVWP